MSGLLRICTAGSVDDGKSTLIGRLLYDSRVGLRGSDQLGREGVEEPHAPGRSTSRCSPTASRPSASRASRSTSRTGTSRPRAASSSSPTRPGTSSTRATWRPARRPPTWRSCWSTRATASARSRGGTRGSRSCSGSPSSCSPSTRWTWSTSTAQVFDDIVDEFAEILRGARIHPIPMSALNGDNVITRERPDAVVRRRRACSSISRRSRSSAPIAAKPFRLPVQLVVAAGPGVPRLRRADPRGIDPRRRPRHRLAVGPHRARQEHRHVGRRSRRWRTRRCR